NTPPTLDSVVVFPMRPRVGDTLTARTTGVFDADAEAVQLSFQWFRVPADGGAPVAVNGGDSNTIDTSTGTGLAPGDALTLTVTPRDSTEPGAPAKSCPRHLAAASAKRWEPLYLANLPVGGAQGGTPPPFIWAESPTFDRHNRRLLFWQGTATFG